MNPYRQNQIMIGLLWLVGVGLTAAAVYFVLFVGASGSGTPSAAARPPQGVDASPTREAVPTETPAPVLPPTELKVGVAYEPRFIWPAQGEITSVMGPEHPGGIDIGLSSGNAPIYAAADGRVAFAGGSDAEDFGIHVIVDHGNSITTLYAHLEAVYVATDDVVTQGKVIGLGGNTGHSTGKHVHFEVRGREGSIDPQDVLPEGTGRTSSNLSCDGKPIPLDRGASAVFDFQQAMLQRESVLRVEFTDPNAPSTLSATPQSRTRVKVLSTLELSANYEQSFEMAVTFQNGDTTRTANCVVTVTTARVAPSFYVRASTPGSAGASAPPEKPAIVCHPSYSGGTDIATKGCITTGVGDYDCYGVGDGPNFVSGRVRVVGSDEFGLDQNRDGIGCDSLDR